MRRDAKSRGATIEAIDRDAVWLRDGGLCGLCGVAADPADWHLDHVKPLARGGDHVFVNVQVAHPVCNMRKGARSTG